MFKKAATQNSKLESKKDLIETPSSEPITSSPNFASQALIPNPQVDKKENFFADIRVANQKKINKLIYLPPALILVAAIYLLKPAIQSFFKVQQTPEVYLPVSTEPKSMHLEINNPDDQIFTLDRTVVVSGKTSPNATIVINVSYPSSNFKEENLGVEANTSGEFQKAVDLKLGVNEITINAFDTQGILKSESREIYYSTDKL